MKNTLSKLLSYLTVLIITTALFIPTASSPGNGPARIQPVLADMASSKPTQIVHVIVQKIVGATQAEQEVYSLGGKVTRDLSIINAFAAELTAGSALELARSLDVRWVSLDAPLVSTGDRKSTRLNSSH